MSFKKEVLMSELEIMLEKEKEMRDLYSHILSKLENNMLFEKIKRIKDEEEKHIGCVKIIIGLFEDETPTESKE